MTRSNGRSTATVQPIARAVAIEDPQRFDPRIHSKPISLAHFGGSYSRIEAFYNAQRVLSQPQRNFLLTAELSVERRQIDREYNSYLIDWEARWTDFKQRRAAVNGDDVQRVLQVMNVLTEGDDLWAMPAAERLRMVREVIIKEGPLDPPTPDEVAAFETAELEHMRILAEFEQRSERNNRTLYLLLIADSLIALSWPYPPDEEHPAPDVLEMSTFEQLPTMVLEFLAVTAVDRVREQYTGKK